MGDFFKFGALAAVLAISGLLAGAARAEDRTFIIPNNADGYGVDRCLANGERCLANGERCGAMVATAYCQSQSFVTVKSFRRVERNEITGAVAVGGTNACVGSCESFVAIECAR